MIDLINIYSCWEIFSDSLKERKRRRDEEMIIEKEDLLISSECWNLMNLICFLINKYILS